MNRQEIKLKCFEIASSLLPAQREFTSLLKCGEELFQAVMKEDTDGEVPAPLVDKQEKTKSKK